MTAPKLIGGRYVLTNEPVREGGMAFVWKAFDPTGDRFCAIKRMKTSRENDFRWKESFNREYAALSDLSGHPNIVSLYDAGVDDDGFYMVLEWVQQNLVNWITERGSLRWERFYDEIGRPILQAVAFAQGRGWNHRDIKPPNILISDDGLPKLSDYGIAKQFEKPALGLTFNQFRSAPFTPPEDDGGEWSSSRDCFSWAAVAVYALTGKMPSDYGALADLTASLNGDSAPITLLQQALSTNPMERPPLASAFLAELTQWEEKSRSQRSETCHIQFDQGCLQRVLSDLDAPDRRDAEEHFLNELNETQVGMRAFINSDKLVPGIRIFAVTWIMEAIRSPKKDSLLIIRAWRSRASAIEYSRENAYRNSLNFTFMPPVNSAVAAAALDELFFGLDGFEAESRERSLVAQRERIFRVWYSFLRAKADFEAQRENAITFVDCKVNESRATLSTELPAPIEIVGQSRVIRHVSGGHVFCDVIDVNLDEVIVQVTSGNAERIPRRGRLELNTVAAEKSIERQRRALDSVNFDRAASPRLRNLLIDPTGARPPLAPPILHVGGGPFDSEKLEILQRAIGMQDILAIQGPPGTGKTRLIEEIMVQYLHCQPHHRILLSSQTHVALDNVIERVRARQPSIEIVRIGRLDDPKIRANCRDLILDRKAQVWADGVRTRAQLYLSQWAEDRGINRSSIEIGMLAERLNLLLQQQQYLRKTVSDATVRIHEIEKRADTKLAETGSAESSDITTASVEAEQAAGDARNALAKIGLALEEVRGRLAQLGGYGLELAEQTDPNMLREWGAMLLGEGDSQAQCRALLELQEEWMLRVGRSSDFHAAMLASADVVAATCIGLASVRGMAEVVYDLCIVDEASKATATEILVPMSRSRKWILVGDPAQLPPFFEDESITRLEDFDETEVRETILDRLLKALPKHALATLINQHRMVKPIGDLISEAFYDGKLNSPKIKPEITLPGVFPKPVNWLSTAGLPDAEEIRRGQSFCNDAECLVVRDALEKIDFIARRRKAIYEVALIAGYVAQVKSLQDVIRDHLHEWSGLKITCSTVDAFQGSEADICIYSIARSNKLGRLGFLREKPRLNVALSRGRSVLIIVGDDVFCRSIEGENPFRRVLEFFDGRPADCERRQIK
jgi:serine/threonine protein kinase